MTQNIDQNEVNKFAKIAESWWDPTGDFKPLHVINPLRANYIDQKSILKKFKSIRCWVWRWSPSRGTPFKRSACNCY